MQGSNGLAQKKGHPKAASCQTESSEWALVSVQTLRLGAAVVVDRGADLGEDIRRNAVEAMRALACAAALRKTSFSDFPVISRSHQGTTSPHLRTFAIVGSFRLGAGMIGEVNARRAAGRFDGRHLPLGHF